MPTGKLKDAFAAQRVLERLFADRAFTAYKSPLTSGTTPIIIKHTGHLATSDAFLFAALAVQGRGRVDYRRTLNGTVGD